MKHSLKKIMPIVLAVAVLAMSGLTVSCASSEANMYERHQSSKGVKVKSNIKVQGTNKANRHTTRSY